MSAYLISLILLFGLLLNGCSSKEELQARRDNAYDISGEYAVKKSNESDVSLFFSVKNESGRHDIVVDLERVDGYSEIEQQFLKKENVSSKDVFKYFGNHIQLGKGLNKINKDHVNGGENISTDFGETSRFHVCSEVYKFSEKKEVYYCLNGTVKKNNTKVTGELSLNVVHIEEKIVNGQKSKSRIINKQSLYYVSYTDQVFYKQYLGKWSGDLYNLSQSNINLPNTLVISNQDDEQMVVQFGDCLPNLHLESEIFEFDREASQQLISVVSESLYPSIHFVYTSDSGRKIVGVGQIWSLGNF